MADAFKPKRRLNRSGTGIHEANEAAQAPQLSSSLKAEEEEVQENKPDKVLTFLDHIRGLQFHQLSSDSLEEVLFANRFELLPPDLSAASVGIGGASSPTRVLPSFSNIPELGELHTALVHGSLKQGPQCVAHVLYPDSVPWPEVLGESSGTAALSPKNAGDVDALAKTPTLTRFTSGGSSVHSVVREESDKASDQVDAPGAASELVASAGGDSPRTALSLRRREDVRATASIASCTTSLDPDKGEVMLCGKRVATTVRGRRLAELSEDYARLYESEAQGERCTAAKQKRQHLERLAKLERYNENKLEERIRELEAMKEAEADYQDEIQKRENKRRARSEQLKKDLSVQIQRKMEEEKVEKEKEQQRQAEAAEAHRRWQRHCQRQKELLQAHHAAVASPSENENTDDRSRTPTVSSRRVASEPPRGRAPAQSRREPAPQVVRTVKQMEAEQRVQRTREALEERPPIAPKPHDLPPPVLEMWDFGSTDRSSSLNSARSQRPARPTVFQQVRAVSNTYGLTEDERGAVQRNLARGVVGAGRMAAYDK